MTNNKEANDTSGNPELTEEEQRKKIQDESYSRLKSSESVKPEPTEEDYINKIREAISPRFKNIASGKPEHISTPPPNVAEEMQSKKNDERFLAILKKAPRAKTSKAPPIVNPMTNSRAKNDSVWRNNESRNQSVVELNKSNRLRNSRLQLTPASSKKSKSINWALPNWLALGKLTILSGPPYIGKSNLAFTIAARVSWGGEHLSWPEISDADLGNVIICSEENWDDKIQPTLEAAGGNMNRIFDIEEKARWTGATVDSTAFSLDPEYIEDLCVWIDTLDGGSVRLIIIDLLSQVVGGDIRSDARVQKTYGQLGSLAKRLNCAILGTAHVSKFTTGRTPIASLAGSIAVGGAPRGIMTMAEIQGGSNEEGTRILVQSKSPNKNVGYGLIFSFDDHNVLGDNGPIKTSRIVWRGMKKGTPKELLTWAEGDKDKVDETIGKFEQAVKLWKTALRNGKRRSTELYEMAKDAEISKTTFDRARVKLKINSKKLKGGGTWCCLPPGIPKDL